jgi:hypothetical protein
MNDKRIECVRANMRAQCLRQIHLTASASVKRLVGKFKPKFLMRNNSVCERTGAC